MRARTVYRCCCLLLALVAVAESQSPKGTDLGRQWKVHQWVLPAADLKGKWTRLGDGNTFDVDYINKATGKPVYSKVTLVSRTARTISFSIAGSKALLVGTISMDGRTIRGTLDPCPAGNTCGWAAETDWAAPAQEVAKKKTATRSLSMEDLGTVWKVHDYTSEGYDYYGTWTLPQTGEVIEFLYKNKADGKEAKGSLLRGDLTGRVLMVKNPGRRKWMHGTIQADGKTVKGTAEWCRNGAQCGCEATIVK